MKCELCGSYNVIQQTEHDIIHNQVGSRRVLVCRDCGFRRNLDECHSEGDLNRKDVTVQQLAQEKASAYQKIRQAQQAPRQPQRTFYQPAQQNGQRAKTNSAGCIVFIVVAIILLSIFLGVLSEL